MDLAKRYLIIGLFLCFFCSCKKTEGEGGHASITGRIVAKHYDPLRDTITGEYAVAYRDVYLIYGDDENYGEKTETNPEGLFEFRYLRPGTYTVYTYSKNIRPPFDFSLPDSMIFKKAEIPRRKHSVDLSTFEIFLYD